MDFGCERGADGLGWRVHMHKGAQYVHMRANINEFPPFKDTHNVERIFDHAVIWNGLFSAGNAWNDQQAGAPASAADANASDRRGDAISKAGSDPELLFFYGRDEAHVVVSSVKCWGREFHAWDGIDPFENWTGRAEIISGRVRTAYFIHDPNDRKHLRRRDAATVTAECPFTPGDTFAPARLVLCGCATVSIPSGGVVSIGDVLTGGPRGTPGENRIVLRVLDSRFHWGGGLRFQRSTRSFLATAGT